MQHLWGLRLVSVVTATALLATAQFTMSSGTAAAEPAPGPVEAVVTSPDGEMSGVVRTTIDGVAAALSAADPRIAALVRTVLFAAYPPLLAQLLPGTDGPPPSSVPSVSWSATKAAPPQKAAHSRIGRPSDGLRLRLVKSIYGRGLAPKSVVATPAGRFFAMNMMYQHTITVYDRRYRKIRTIKDSIRLSDFVPGARSAQVAGSPVEAAVAQDGEFIYISQYTMFGRGFPNPGYDKCVQPNRIDRSYVYKVSVASLKIVDIYRVGKVPKYLATSPDGRYLLVGNWCSWDVSVVDLSQNKLVKSIPAGINPRGIAFSPDGRTAYVSLAGEGDILIVDMRRLKVSGRVNDVCTRPRHLVMSPNGRKMYVTCEGVDSPKLHDGVVLKMNLATLKVVDSTRGLVEPRTTVMAPDGKSLYLVDYYPGRIVKIATSNMKVLQSKALGHHPIGVTYDGPTNHIWVAGYGGALWVLKDR